MLDDAIDDLINKLILFVNKSPYSQFNNTNSRKKSKSVTILSDSDDSLKLKGDVDTREFVMEDDEESDDSEPESHEDASDSEENEDDEAIDDESDGVDADGKEDDDDIVIDDGGHCVSNTDKV